MRLAWLLVLCLSAAVPVARAAAPLRVFAAASLTGAMQELSVQWARQGHAAPVLVFAGSAALARQIEAGAPSDVYASADPRWMDHLQSRGRIAAGSRVDLLGNALVLVAPAGRGFDARLESGFDLAAAFDGPLCTGEPDAVPAGRYAREALQWLGMWAALERRIVGAGDVRAALSFVARGECAAGIVYASDARVTPQVQVVARFPTGSHAAIVYPFAEVEGAGAEASEFLRFLASDEAAEVFVRHGFDRIGR